MCELLRRDKKFFDLARKMSHKSNHHRHKLGCVITRKKTIVGIGWNQIKSHSAAPTKFHMIHAEFHAILGVLPSDINGATAYVYREHKDGKVAMAKPCSICQRMFRDCNIKKIYYTTEAGYEILQLD